MVNGKNGKNGKAKGRALKILGPPDEPDESEILDSELDTEFETLPDLEDADKPPLSRKSRGRNPSAPGILGKLNPMLAGAQDSQSHAASFLEDYNALERLLEPGNSQEDLDARTELNELQIVNYARGEIMAEFYHSKILASYVASLKRKMISKARKGRKEFVSAFQSSQYGEVEAYGNAARSLSDKLSR